MEPSYFYFFVLPLGVLIVFLVSLVLYIARKEENLYDQEFKKLRTMLQSGTIDKETFERMRNRIKQEIFFAEELERIYNLFLDKKIDQDTYVHLRELLEKSFRLKLTKLVA